MPLRLQPTTNREDITDLWVPGASANPVIRLSAANGAPIWLKAASGGARIEFAGTVMARAGFANQGTRSVPATEARNALPHLKRVAQTMRATVGADLLMLDQIDANIRAMEKRLGEGQDFILTENVAGRTLAKHLEVRSNAATVTSFEELVNIFTNPVTQADMARLIAADLFLGNFDRIAVNTGDQSRMGQAFHSKFNAANWIYDNFHFLPIDNDTFAPSAEHLTSRQIPGNTEPTNEDVYRVIIQGGLLDPSEKMEALYPVGAQSSPDTLLGAGAIQAIYDIMISNVSGRNNAEKAIERQTHGPALMAAATQIAPRIQIEMANLLAELKNGNNGLNKLFKANANVEGMNYGSFKFRSRFVSLLLAGRNQAEATTEAFAYGAYRQWKILWETYRDHRPDVAYGPYLPQNDVKKLSNSEKAGRFLSGVASKIKSTPEQDRKKLAGNVKQELRDQGKTERSARARGETPAGPSRAKLVEQLNRLGSGNSDNRIIKAQTLLLAELLTLELKEIYKFLSQLRTDVQGKSPMAALYLKTVRKNNRLSAVIESYQLIVDAVMAQRGNFSEMGDKARFMTMNEAFDGTRVMATTVTRYL